MSNLDQAITKLAEAVSILLEHASPMTVPLSEEEWKAANQAVDDALAAAHGTEVNVDAET